MKTSLRVSVAAVCILAFLSCGGYVGTTRVKEVPPQPYGKIIYLRTEDPGALDKTLGLIYVLPGKSITTTYPFKWEIKSENQLTPEEKVNFPSMKILELKKKDGDLQGYIRILGPAIVNVFDTKDGVAVTLDNTSTLGKFPEPPFTGGAGGGASPSRP